MAQNKKILVIYSTMFGSTTEIAKFIAKELTDSDFNVDTMHVGDQVNLKDYDSVIIGSPIKFDRWLIEAKNFVKENKEVLKNKKVIYFFACMTLSKESKSTKSRADSYVKELINLVPEVKPITVKGFAGAIDFKKIPLYLKIPLRIILLIKGATEGDYRDWNKIKQWVKEIKLLI